MMMNYSINLIFNILNDKKYIYENLKQLILEEETDPGYLKLKFDHRDGLLPRSVISFYHSSNGREWVQIGSNHTKWFNY